MLKTLRLGRFFGIDTYIHWSFWILVLWTFLSQSFDLGIHAGLMILPLLALVFFCIYLHELGHALVARHFGVATVDITLLPFGGLARLSSRAPNAWAEFWIAIGGPLVNVAIALLLGGALYLVVNLGAIDPETIGNPENTTDSAPALSWSPSEWSMLLQLLAINIMLAVFNLIPAFPMDGGRILRSLLAPNFGHLRATEIAARVGRWIAYVMIGFGFIRGYWSLAMIGIFVIISGFAEVWSTRYASLVEQGLAQPGSSPAGRFQASWNARYGWQATSPYAQGSSDARVENQEVIDADDVRRLD